jgi:hypothetical protein
VEILTHDTVDAASHVHALPVTIVTSSEPPDAGVEIDDGSARYVQLGAGTGSGAGVLG